ncbi:Two component regulator propeller [Zhouia amylolytica]|uniref:Two component regulator propeller n=1 Tax=Zhouia amylolytica TaxID=376730 RepID=A0A1I6VBS9_9FLAO|nr:two-component regulator propeller domain-containing protein [Zhouia amylolytica]SFT11075.1 Two component regulator propeller [Zhouia amylolytica]
MKLILQIILSITLVSCNGQVQNNSLSETKPDLKIEKPIGNVYCGFLDKDDNLWFGTTNDGVYKYDGSNFIHFTQEDGLSHNKVSCIYQAENGNLWFGTANGVSIFDGTKFTHLKIPKTEISTDWLKNSFPVVNPNEVQSINQDENGIFWLGTNGAGAYSYDGKTFKNHLSEIGNKMPDSLYHNIIQSISKDNQGNLWFVSMSHGGISKYDGNAFTHYLPKDGISDDMVRTSLVDSKGDIWFGFNGNRKSGLTYTNGISFQTYSTDDGLCSRNVRAIYEDTKGKLWIGGMQGLCVFDGNTFTNFKDNENKTYERIVFIIGDTKGKIWFGGLNGFWKYDGERVIDMTRKN